MATGNYKVPPAFDEKKSYGSWKNEVEIWRKEAGPGGCFIANEKSEGQHAENNCRGFEQRWWNDYASDKTGLCFWKRKKAASMRHTQSLSRDAAAAAYCTRFTSRRKSRSNPQNQTAVQGTNTLKRHRRRTRCAVCQSTYHLVKDCPHKNKKTCKTNRRWKTDGCWMRHYFVVKKRIAWHRDFQQAIWPVVNCSLVVPWDTKRVRSSFQVLNLHLVTYWVYSYHKIKSCVKVKNSVILMCQFMIIMGFYFSTSLMAFGFQEVINIT